MTTAPTSQPVETSGTHPRLDFESKVAMLCSYYADRKPEHRAKLLVPHPKAENVTVQFNAGKVLADLSKCFHPLRPPEKSIHKNQKEQLEAVEWFRPWLDALFASRTAGPNGEEPDLAEKVRLLCKTYATGARPKANEIKTVTRDNGRTYALCGFRLLQKIAPNWFGTPTKHCELDDDHKQAVEKLPWAKEWLAVGQRRRDVARLGKIFTKEKKIALLVQHYTIKARNGEPAEKPSWNDVLPQKVPEEAGGGRWDFRPATFLDDLVGNWFCGDKPGVVLSAEQKSQLEALPWVPSWIASVAAARLKKQENSCKRQRSEGSLHLDNIESPSKISRREEQFHTEDSGSSQQTQQESSDSD
tara:strand:- start:4352 stop:5425 length:1074 start_codon:yes stop_codon:yes gene_type:complete